MTTRDTLWAVIEAYVTIFNRDKTRTADVVDALIATDMYLPIASGSSLFVWSYENGYLPRD